MSPISIECDRIYFINNNQKCFNSYLNASHYFKAFSLIPVVQCETPFDNEVFHDRENASFVETSLTGLLCGVWFWCNVKRLEYTVRSFLTYSLHFWSSEMPLDKIFYKITVTLIFAVEFNLTQKLRKMIFPSGFKNSKLNGKWRWVLKTSKIQWKSMKSDDFHS